VLRVSEGNGVEVALGSTRIFLDPRKRAADAFVTHGHTDHLMADAHMTPPTLDFLRVRKPASSGTSLPYGDAVDVGAMRVTLHDAGHILGGAMVRVETPEGTLVYTGDFNPRPGFTTGAAEPLPCDVLVTESTYGDPRFDLPPRDLVLASLEAWTLNRLLKGPVALGAYPLGRAQELVAMANHAGVVPVVSPDIAALTAVYNAHGHDLAYAVAGTERARDLDASGALHIVPKASLKKDADFARGLKARGGSAAYLSGWCHRYSYFETYAIDAQFALSDHASFGDIVEFVQATGAQRVYTTHGASLPLARELRRRLGVRAEALQKAPEAGAAPVQATL
jgi:putative mRNA 3-end processing factor